jgi:hypothetical protein
MKTPKLKVNSLIPRGIIVAIVMIYAMIWGVVLTDETHSWGVRDWKTVKAEQREHVEWIESLSLTDFVLLWLQIIPSD